MKLHSLTVKNFKIHRERHVEFDDRLTLISGPNETGKSTLLEALRKAFFLRARGGSEHHTSTRSELHAGLPEVEVVFSVGGATYTLLKRFGGLQGVARLAQHAGQTWQGDEVDEQLAVLFKIAPGRRPNEWDEPWQHLFTCQGESGADPMDLANGQHEGLVRRLQLQGGAAVILSERDTKVAAGIADKKEEAFTQRGQPSAGSILATAASEAETANAALTNAEARQNALVSAENDYADALETIRSKTSDLALLEPQKIEVDAKLESARSLTAQKELQQIEVSNAVAVYGRINTADIKIKGLRSEIGNLREAMAPLQTNVSILQKAVEEAAAALSASTAAYASASQSERDSRTRRDVAAAWVDKLEKEKLLADLSARFEAIRKLKKDLDDLTDQRAKVPQVSEDALEGLRESENEINKAKAVLNATATKIKILKTDVPVTVGGEALATGQEMILTVETNLSVGSTLSLAIIPGGESGLLEAKKAVEDAEEKHRDLLERANVNSVSEAQAANTRLRDLRGAIENLEARLLDANALQVEENFDEAKDSLAQATTAFNNRNTQPHGITAFPAVIKESKDLLKTEEEAFAAAEAAKAAAETNKNQCQGELDRKRSELSESEQLITERNAEINNKTIEVDLIIGEHGDDLPRSQALQSAMDIKTTKEAALASTCAALEQLQVDQLNREQARLAKSLENCRNDLNLGIQRKAVSESLLRRDGSEDPESAVKRAKAVAELADKNLEGIRRKAYAIKRIHELFQEEKRELAHQYTRPLADKIRAYLHCLFGPSVSVDLVLEENSFEGIKISRTDFGNVAFNFDQLSGGAEEQVAAAVRLAIAQILAEEHDGQLPVVFDDSFTNSDTERVRKIQGMLDLAAENGLQVIVLSCNDTDYNSLGARSVSLPRMQLHASTAAPLSGNEPPTVPDEAEQDEGEVADQAVEAAAPVETTQVQKEEFLERLRAEGGKSGNIKLRGQLGWDEPTYGAVKTALVASGQISTGAGRGGSVSLMN